MTNNLNKRELVVPGDLVYEGSDMLAGSGTYKEDSKVYSKYLGFTSFSGKYVRVMPLRGRYIPKEGDLVIGTISKMFFSSWVIELNSPYSGTLTVAESSDEYIDLNEKHLSDYFDVRDVVLVKIKSVNKKFDVMLTMKDRMAKKITGGQIVEVSPTKVPRLIGKGGTMVTTIKNKTNTTILIGQNGRIWVRGDNADIAVEAIRKIDEESHIPGLTEKISDWLDQRLKK